MRLCPNVQCLEGRGRERPFTSWGAGKAKCLAEPPKHGHWKEANLVYTGVIPEHLPEDRAFEPSLED